MTRTFARPDTASTQSAGASTNGGHRPGRCGSRAGNNPGTGLTTPPAPARRRRRRDPGRHRWRGPPGRHWTPQPPSPRSRQSAAWQPNSSTASWDSSRRPAAAEQPGPRSPPQWAHATARPPRNVTPTSPAAAPVHHQWTRQRHQKSRSSRPGTTAVPRARTPPAPGTPRHRPRRAIPHGHEGQDRPPPPVRSCPGNSGRRRIVAGHRPRPAEAGSAQKITGVIIAESPVRARAGTRLSRDSRLARPRRRQARRGLVRPTWRGERSRPGEVGTVRQRRPRAARHRNRPDHSAGPRSTRDAAAVSLLRALQRQQENEAQAQARTVKTSTIVDTAGLPLPSPGSPRLSLDPPRK